MDIHARNVFCHKNLLIQDWYWTDKIFFYLAGKSHAGGVFIDFPGVSPHRADPGVFGKIRSFVKFSRFFVNETSQSLECHSYNTQMQAGTKQKDGWC